MVSSTKLLTHAPVTFEQFALACPEDLDGRHGVNRRHGGFCQIEATQDAEAIACWLREFEGSPQTFRNYRKEAERLLLWSVTQCGKPLSSLMREDLQTYQAFLADPQPRAFWCGPGAPRTSGAWRPFRGPLSPASQRQTLIVINALFSYLVEAGYLAGNPLSLIRRRHKVLQPEVKEAVGVERFLDQETWWYLKRFLQDLPRETSRQKAHFERNRFLFYFLYLLAPRVSEAAGATMGSFYETRGKWWWQITGKGQKTARVPVSEEMLEALIRYRQFLGLSDLPANGDASPLLRSLKGTSDITANMVYRIVKAVLRAAADAIIEEAPRAADKLRRASTHWLRHTAITHGDDAGVSLKHLKRSARHEKIETTVAYQHAEDEVWHEDWSKHRY